MSYRCTNAFWFGEKVYSGGQSVDDDDPILKTHSENFTRVSESAGITAVETASAAPGEPRVHAEPQKKVAPKSAKPASSKSEADGNSKEETGS